jgi:hypothetical protein
MKSPIRRSALLAGLLIYMIAQPAIAFEPHETPHQAAPASVVRWYDVSLDGNGAMHGHILNQSGASISHAKVSVYRLNQIVLSTETNDQGEFTIRGLRGGLYQVVASNANGESGVALYRVWAAGTAPPSSISDVVMVMRQEVVRGQWCANPAAFFTKPVVAAAVLTTAAVLPIVINNSGS